MQPCCFLYICSVFLYLFFDLQFTMKTFLVLFYFIYLMNSPRGLTPVFSLLSTILLSIAISSTLLRESVGPGRSRAV